MGWWGAQSQWSFRLHHHSLFHGPWSPGDVGRGQWMLWTGLSVVRQLLREVLVSSERESGQPVLRKVDSTDLPTLSNLGKAPPSALQLFCITLPSPQSL